MTDSKGPTREDETKIALAAALLAVIAALWYTEIYKFLSQDFAGATSLILAITGVFLFLYLFAFGIALTGYNFFGQNYESWKNIADNIYTFGFLLALLSFTFFIGISILSKVFPTLLENDWALYIVLVVSVVLVFEGAAKMISKACNYSKRVWKWANKF